MIKVLDKTFSILEEIVRATPHPVSPLEVAERLGLNRATCSRIIKMLLDSGYVIQISRQAGYVAGPRILTLGNMAAFQSVLMKAAVPVIDRTAETLEDSAMISQVWHGERYVLYLTNRNRRKNIRLNHLSYPDIYNTASGAVEMAYRTPEDAMQLYDNMPDSARHWLLPEFQKRDQILRELGKIRKNGFYHSPRGEIGIFAFPVFSNRRFLASVGCAVDISKYTEEKIPLILSTGKNAAKEISGALSTTDYIG